MSPPQPPPEPSAETHRYVPGYPGYCVSRSGQLFSCRSGKRWRPVSPCRNGKGAWTVVVWIGDPGASKRRTVRLARLVALAWVGPCPPGCAVAHKDNDRSNLDADNLCWKTRRERRLHTLLRGSRHPLAVLDESRVVRIRLEVHAADREGKAPDWEGVAKREGVHPQSVKMVAWGKIWKHVDAGVPYLKPGPRRREKVGGYRKLTVEQVRRIKDRLARGETPTQIHPEYADVCTLANIAAIKRGLTWKHV